MKLARLPDNQDKNARRRLNPKTKLNLPLADTDDNLTDFEDCDFDGEAEYGWGGDETSDCDIFEHVNEEDELLLSRYDKFNITQDDRVEVKHALKNKIDNDKYYVCASSTRNRLCIIWRKRESRKLRKQHANAVGGISKIPGSRTLYGSRTSKLGLHGMVEFLHRARDWQEWHSNIIRGWAGRLYVHVKTPTRGSVRVLPKHQAVMTRAEYWACGSIQSPVVPYEDALNSAWVYG